MDPTAPIETAASTPEVSSTTQQSSSSFEKDSGFDWGTRLDSLLDAASEGKDPYAEKEPEVEKPKAEKKAKGAKAKVKEEPTPEKEETPEEPEKEEEKDETEEEPKAEEAPSNLTDKAKVKWGELRAEAQKAKEYAKEIETLKADLEKAKTAVVDTSEVERLKQINQEYESELAVARVEATQEYKANVVTPMVNVVGYLNQLAEKYELSSKEMLTAMAESDPAKQSDLIADIAASMNERDRLKFYASADDYSEIIRRRDMFQNSARERMSQIEESRQAEIAKQTAESEKASTEAKEAYEKATDKVFEDLKKSVPVLSDEEIAADVQRLAKGDYSNANPELKAYLAHSGALLPHILKALKEAKSELDAANKKIVGYRNGSPKAGSGSADMSRSVSEDVGFLEALDAQLG
jgi:hypothetical protein